MVADAAIIASTALPPARSTEQPASAAKPWGATTIPVCARTTCAIIERPCEWGCGFLRFILGHCRRHHGACHGAAPLLRLGRDAAELVARAAGCGYFLPIRRAETDPPPGAVKGGGGWARPPRLRSRAFRGK